VAQSISNRPQKVAQLIQQELGTLFIQGLKDPRIGFATVTEVRVSGDLRQARVFVSVYGSEEERSESLKGLTAAAGYLRRQLSRSLRLRFMPELEFALDTSLDEAQRLEDIISAIEAGDSEVPDRSTQETVPVATDRDALNKSAMRMEEDRHRRASAKASRSSQRSKRKRNRR